MDDFIFSVKSLKPTKLDPNQLPLLENCIILGLKSNEMGKMQRTFVDYLTRTQMQ